MPSFDEEYHRDAAPRMLVVLLAAAVGVCAGFFGSICGPYYVMVVGAVAAAITGIGVVRRARWSRVGLIVAVAIIVGAVLYLVIGILTPDGASSGFGNIDV